MKKKEGKTDLEKILEKLNSRSNRGVKSFIFDYLKQVNSNEEKVRRFRENTVQYYLRSTLEIGVDKILFDVSENGRSNVYINFRGRMKFRAIEDELPGLMERFHMFDYLKELTGVYVPEDSGKVFDFYCSVDKAIPLRVTLLKDEQKYKFILEKSYDN